MEWTEIVTGSCRRSARSRSKRMPLPPPVSHIPSSDSDVDIINCNDDEVIHLSSSSDNDITVVFQAGKKINDNEETESLPSTESVVSIATVTADGRILSGPPDADTMVSTRSNRNPPPQQGTKSKSGETRSHSGEKETETEVPTTAKSGATPGEYVLFYDPLNDILDELGLGDPEPTNGAESQESAREDQLNGNGTVTTPPETSHSGSNRSDSPQPSTSKSCIVNNRKRKGSSVNPSQESTQSKKVRFSDVGSRKSSSSSEESDNESVSGVPSKKKSTKLNLKSKTKARQVIVSSDSGSESSSSMFEAIIVRKKVKKLQSSGETPSSGNSKGQTSEKRPKRQRGAKKKKVADSDSSSAEDQGKRESSGNSDARKRKKGDTKRPTRRSARKPGSKASKKDEAFALLRAKREKLANKPKRATPTRAENTKSTDEEESEDSDDSSYTSGYSPCPIVDDDEATPDGSDFNGSSDTPSSSSVTSAGETDEEPDLEIGGSDGERELEKEKKKNGKVSESSDDDQEDAKSCSSSSDGEPPDDGQNDNRCILCKNLGSANIEGRKDMENANWCKCGECEIFSSDVGDYDLVCCREIKTVADFIDEELEDSKCVTKHPRFDFDVLENEGYARSISKHQPARRFQGSYWGNFSENYTCGKADMKKYEEAKQNFHRSNRYGKMIKSISSYLHWIFDRLGREKNQMVIPACVQSKIRREFGIPDCFFEPFRSRYRCSVGSHCRLAQ